MQRRSVGAPESIESERLFPKTEFHNAAPGPGGYIVPSNLINGTAKRFGKPEVVDIFDTK